MPSEILTQVEGTENKELPTTSDFLSLIPDAEDIVSTDKVKKIVRYVDEQGKELAKPTEISSGELKKTVDGATGDATYDPEFARVGAVSVPTIPNWEVKEVPDEVLQDQTVRYGDKDLEYTVVYQHHKTITTDSVQKTIRYVDEEGKELEKSDVFTSKELKKIVDDVTGEVTYEPETGTVGHGELLTIDNWEVKEVPDEVLQDQTVKYGDKDLEYTVVYKVKRR